jgi:hypothetical protein
MISSDRDLRQLDLTLQLEQKSQCRLVICGLFARMRSQDGFDVFDQILRFEQFSKSIADRVDLVGSVSSVFNARGIDQGHTMKSWLC